MIYLKAYVKILIGAVTLITSAIYVSQKFCGYALTKNHSFGKGGCSENSTFHGEDEGEAVKALSERRKKYREWFCSNSEDLFLLNNSGQKIHASLILKQGGYTSKYAVLCHGYNDDCTAMGYEAYRFNRLGYNVLALDARASGKSDGKYIGMGWLERLDVKGFVNFILGRDVDAQIVLYGMSMGASEVLMATGEKLPPNVRCVIEDCGYTSVWDIFGISLKKLFRLPKYPVLPIVSTYCKLAAGYDFREASALEAVKKSDIPTLFIHGDKDKFVPSEMAERLYKAAVCEKELLIVEGAGHIQSDVVETEKYWDKIAEFTAKYILAE